MNIPPYWIREQREIAGITMRLQAYSRHSPADARTRMEEKVRVLSAFYASPASPEAVESMRSSLRALDEQPEESDYSAAILEPLLRRVDARNIITRNRYGAEVLNSEDTCFLDVDSFPPSWAERIRSIFSRRRSDEERLLAAAAALCAEDAAMSIRVYRTAGGWRLIVAADDLYPVSPRAEALMRRLRVDTIYTRLCHRQACWRARLTPKPYRLGMPTRYPRPALSGAVTEAEQEWIALYEQKSASVAVCRLVDTFGPPLRSAIIELHDELTAALQVDRRLL